MKKVEEIKDFVKREFDVMLQDRIDVFMHRIEYKIQRSLFKAVPSDNSQSINSALSGVTEVNVTEIIQEVLNDSRPEVKEEVFKRIRAANYNLVKNVRYSKHIVTGISGLVALEGAGETGDEIVEEIDGVPTYISYVLKF